MNCQYCGTHWESDRRVCWDGGNGCGAVLVGPSKETGMLCVDVADVLDCPGTIVLGRSSWGCIVAADLINMLERLAPTDAAVWAMARSAYPSVMGAVSNWGRNNGPPFYEWFPQGELQRYEYLFGIRLIWSRLAPVISKPGDVALVDWQVYQDRAAWPQEITYLDDMTSQISPFVVLGKSWQEEHPQQYYQPKRGLLERLGL